MRIFLAGTPGIISRERVAKDFKKEALVLLGYFSEDLCCKRSV
jgi:hypothetical protein